MSSPTLKSDSSLVIALRHGNPVATGGLRWQWQHLVFL